MYFLWKAVLALKPKIKLSKNEFDHLGLAKHETTLAIYIEEKWDGVVRNYVESELSFLDSALRSMIEDEDSHEDFQLTRLKFSRRLSNLSSLL